MYFFSGFLTLFFVLLLQVQAYIFSTMILKTLIRHLVHSLFITILKQYTSLISFWVSFPYLQIRALESYTPQYSIYTQSPYRYLMHFKEYLYTRNIKDFTRNKKITNKIAKFTPLFFKTQKNYLWFSYIHKIYIYEKKLWNLQCCRLLDAPTPVINKFTTTL